MGSLAVCAGSVAVETCTAHLLDGCVKVVCLACKPLLQEVVPEVCTGSTNEEAPQLQKHTDMIGQVRPGCKLRLPSTGANPINAIGQVLQVRLARFGAEHVSRLQDSLSWVLTAILSVRCRL